MLENTNLDNIDIVIEDLVSEYSNADKKCPLKITPLTIRPHNIGPPKMLTNASTFLI